MINFKIANLGEFTSNDLPDISSELDLLIASCSAESRCLKIAEDLRGKKGLFKKIVFTQQCSTDDGRHINKFLDMNYENVSFGQNSKQTGIDKILSTGEKKLISICIDISCMHRRLIATLVSDILTLSRNTNVNVYFAYTIAKYKEPTSFTIKPNEKVKPVHPQFAGWSASPEHPVVAIVGLGYEKEKAIGAVEYINPSEWILFSPKSPETRYEPKVREHNRDLIEATQLRNRFEYDVTNPIKTATSLGSLVAGLKQSARPVLFPFGPKIFFVISILVAIAHPQVSVWYVSGEEDDESVDKKPSPLIGSFGLKCSFSHAEAEPIA